VSRAARLAIAVDALPLVGSPTGVGVFCDQLIRSLATRNELVLSAFAVGRGAVGARHRLPPSVRCRVLPVPARLVHAAWRVTGVPSAEIVAGRVAVVHGTNFVVPPTRRAAAVVTVHDMSPWRYPELCPPASRAYPALVRQALLRGAYVHTPSQFVADELVSLVGADPARVRAIPHGLGRPDRRGERSLAGEGVGSAEPAAEGWGSDGPAGDDATSDARTATAPSAPSVASPYVLAIGTIEPRKDYPTLVAAFDEVAARRPGLRLVIVGSEDRGSRALDAAVAASHCGERIIRLGYVAGSSRASLLAGAAVLAYPSIYEGFGLPPLEAMAAGVPVVATAGGAIPEVVGDGAVVVPVGDPAVLADALARILDDDQFRQEQVARGLARASGYSWQATASAMVALYVEAAADRGRRVGIETSGGHGE